MVGARDVVSRLGGAPTRLVFAGLLVFAITLRVAYFLDYVETIPTYLRPIVDAKIYDDWSARIANGDILGRDEGVFYRAPLYPYLLAGLRAAFGSLQPATALLQMLLGLATALLTARLALKWAGPVAGCATFGLLSLYGPLYTAEPKLLGTVLGLFLQVVVLTLATALADRPRVRTALLLGLVLGAAVLVRPFWILWAVALPPLVLGFRGAVTRSRIWLSFLLGLVLFVAPVTLRNYFVGGDFVPVASNGGMTFFQGNNVENRSGLLTIISRFDMFGSAERQEEVESRVASELSGRELSPSETSRFWFRQGLVFITRSPGAWLELEGKKFLRLVSSFEPGDNYSHALERDRIPVLVWLFLPFGLLLALSLWSLSAPRPFPPAARLAVLGAATGALGCLVFFVSSRYRLEAVPGLAILAGASVADLVGRIPFGSGAGTTVKWSETSPLRGSVTALLIIAVLILSGLPPGPPALSQQSISLLQIGNAYERRGDRDAARRAYVESIESLPENAFAWRSLLQLTVQDSGAAVALDRLDATPSEVRENPEIRHLRGRFLAALGRSVEAIEELRTVTRERPEMREAWFYLGTALRETGQYPEAEEALERALATGWPDREVFSALSFVRVQTGDLVGAREAANRALASDPEQSAVQLNLIVADVYLGELDEAATLLEERPPEDPLTFYYRGLIALRRGEFEAAAAQLAQAVATQPGNRRARYYETLARAARGDRSGSWPGDGEEESLVAQWIAARAQNPWSGVPTEGRTRAIWDSISARPVGALAEVVRYVGEEEAGLRPAGNP